jgi:hypothetical protein
MPSTTRAAWGKRIEMWGYGSAVVVDGTGRARRTEWTVVADGTGNAASWLVRRLRREPREANGPNVRRRRHGKCSDLARPAREPCDGAGKCCGMSNHALRANDLFVHGGPSSSPTTV